MDFKGQLEHTKPYAEAFWQHEMLDRPYVCVTAPLRPSDFAWSPARSFQLCMGEQYEKIVDSFLEHVEATYYGGEALPALELTLGPDQYAGFLGGTIQASEDVGTTWVLPCVEDWTAIEEEAQFLDHCVYHLDGKEALVHLDTVLSIDKIDCIQWVPGAGQPRTPEWMELLKRIQAAGKAVWIYDWTLEEIKAYHRELKPDRVAYQVAASSPSEAEELLRFLRENT